MESNCEIIDNSSANIETVTPNIEKDSPSNVANIALSYAQVLESSKTITNPFHDNEQIMKKKLNKDSTLDAIHLINSKAIEATPLIDDFLNYFSVSDVLTGEMPIAILDYISEKLALLSPSRLHIATMNNTDLGLCRVKSSVVNIQMHYINNHYVVTQQINRVIRVYDSLSNPCTRLTSLYNQLRILYELTDECPLESRVTFPSCQQQGFTNDCGAFTIINALLLYLGRDPSYVNLDQSKMRPFILSYKTVCFN